MRISEFAEQTGLSKDTIRYYEKINLILPAIHNKQRDYSSGDVERMDTIIKLKDTGFTLMEIKALFDWSRDADHHSELSEAEVKNLRQIKALFQEKYAEMLQKEERIKEMKQVLVNANQKVDYLLEKNK
ncbi:MerR family transcriptional regulator [Paucisalibacillus globulus]|uniref:MerR family transcriptional regulator n=1 Tax=Paucisalibacillus globulus TaxID=351095 RepID=UPI00040086CF|nr:MerR family transcriptional regulator [Paucisalibacillus globulus]